jgi:hypothetical protein
LRRLGAAGVFSPCDLLKSASIRTLRDDSRLASLRFHNGAKPTRRLATRASCSHGWVTWGGGNSELLNSWRSRFSHRPPAASERGKHTIRLPQRSRFLARVFMRGTYVRLHARRRPRAPRGRGTAPLARRDGLRESSDAGSSALVSGGRGRFWSRVSSHRRERRKVGRGVNTVDAVVFILHEVGGLILVIAVAHQSSRLCRGVSAGSVSSSGEPLLQRLDTIGIESRYAPEDVHPVRRGALFLTRLDSGEATDRRFGAIDLLQ